MYTPGHSCTQPSKPRQFTSQAQVRRFETDVEMYRSCINLFVEEQREAAEANGQAADTAIHEWNHFVRYELE